MRFILVKHPPRDGNFPNHVQWRATCLPIDHFFWVHERDGDIGAKEFIRKRYPAATFSDETVC